MKKIIAVLIFIICAFNSWAQPVPVSQNIYQGNVVQILHIRGGVTGDYSVMIPVIDTLNNYATTIRGALTVRPQDNVLYKSNGVFWEAMVSNSTGYIIDSIYVERPIGVKWGTSGAANGKQIIYFLKESGLISGGVPFSTGCRTLTMPPSVYNINFNQYSSPSTDLVIDTSHATLNRTDRIVGDTNGIISVLKGTASALGLPPPYDPSSQFSLALISIPAASTCTPPSSSTKVIFDQDLGVPSEYDLTTVGAIAADPDNTDNPYHLTKALFISTYVDSSQAVFTNTGLQDTVTSTSALVLPTYLNNRLTNPIQVEFFLNTTSVSNNTVINSHINTQDTGQYQVAVIPFTAFGFNSNYFNKIVFTFRGWDTSGAAGLYFDYIQIQKGITSFETDRYVDSVKNVNNRLVYYKSGIAYDGGAIGGGGSSDSTLQQATDASIAAGDNPYINAHNSSFIIDSTENFIANGSNGFVFEARIPGDTAIATFGGSASPPVLEAVTFITTGGNTYDHRLQIQPTVIELTAATNFVNSHTHLRINHADTLLTPPTYVYVPDNDTIKVYPFPAGGGWGTTGTIATLTGDGTIDADGYILKVQNGGEDFLVIEPTVNNESVKLRAYNNTDDGNESHFYASTGNLSAFVRMQAAFNDGVKEAEIKGEVDATASALTYTADSHLFSGIPIFDTQFTPANSTDATYPEKTLSASDTFLYYRKTNGTWVKIAWTAF